jgi:CO/xanthine dehydrogenase FAD-binding subunit
MKCVFRENVLTYHAPQTLDAALRLLADGQVKIVAGGTDFFPTLPKGRLEYSLLDITGISGFRCIQHLDDGSWRIGSATTWSDLLAEDLPSVFDALKAASREVGSLQIQNAATIVGNLCNASPAADGVPALLILEAQIEISSMREVRIIPLTEFISGVRQTALAEGEIVTAILIPPQPEHAKSSFEKLGSRRFLVISITMVAVLIGLDQNGRIDIARVAIGACSPVAKRQPTLEKSILGLRPENVVLRSDMLEGLSPIDDVRGDIAFRLSAALEQCSRAISEVTT